MTERHPAGRRPDDGSGPDHQPTRLGPDAHHRGTVYRSASVTGHHHQEADSTVRPSHHRDLPPVALQDRRDDFGRSDDGGPGLPFRSPRSGPPQGPRHTRRKAIIAVAGVGLATAACSRAATTTQVKEAMGPFVEGLVAPAGTTVTAPPVAAPTFTPEPPAVAIDLPEERQVGTRTRRRSAQKSNTSGYVDREDSLMGPSKDKFQKVAPTNQKVYPGPAAAAAATTVTVATVLAKDPIKHLLGRASFGATPALYEQVKQVGIDQWISGQLAPASIPDPTADAVVGQFGTVAMTTEQLRNRQGDDKPDPQRELGQATLARQIWSDRQLFEVMVDFWNDFLHIGSPFDGGENVRTSFDNDVIRQFTLGKYVDMYLAANRHPALLRYLNNDQSSKDSVNENLGREDLELYSLGVDGGYTEADVRNMAYILTGRTIDDDQFAYDAGRHFTGPVTVLGFTDPNPTGEGGLEVGEKALRYLALHPSTARYIARKLCLHFVSDVPPPSLVDRLARKYLESGSDIVPVLVTLFSSGEFWGSVGQKVRRPMEYVASTYRTLGVQPGGETKKGVEGLYYKLRDLGHAPLNWDAPNGFPKVYVAWTSSGATIEEWNEGLAAVEGRRQEFSFTAAEDLLGANPPGTAGAYIDALSRRLVQQTMIPAHRAAVLEFLGVGEQTAVDRTLDGKVASVARLIVAGPYQALR